MPTINTSPRGIAPCSGYGWTTFDNTADFNMIAAYLESTMIHRRSRIRQNGTIKEVEFRMNTVPAALTGLFISVWRWNGATYNRVGTSENLRPSLVVGVNRKVLASQIAGVQEGDYVSIIHTGTPTLLSMMSMSSAGAGNAHLRYIQSDPGNTLNWDVQSTLVDKYVMIRCYMDSPAVVFIGDSHVAGANAHRSFVEDRPVSEDHTLTSISTTMPYQAMQLAPAFLTHVTYQNMGIGGENISATAARYLADAKNLLPHIVISMSGWNDVRLGETNPNNLLPHLQTQLGHANDDPHKLGYIEGAPLTGESNAEHQVFDAWMALAASTIEASSAQALLILQRYLTGTFRAGGDAGNKWDWLPGFADPDLIHPLPPANVKVAEAVWDYLEPFLFPPFIAPAPTRYTDVDKFARDIWPAAPGQQLPRVVIAAARMSFDFINSTLGNKYPVPFAAPYPSIIVTISDLLTKCIATALQARKSPQMPKMGSIKREKAFDNECTMAAFWLQELMLGTMTITDVPPSTVNEALYTRAGFTPFADVDNELNHRVDPDLIDRIERERE